MEFTYKKHDNSKLFLSLEKSGLGLTHIQNYIPLYNNFFVLTEANWNNINLNNKMYLYSIQNKETDNIVNGMIKDINGTTKIKKPVFFKYSPLLDPLKYIIGKYDIEDTNLLNLPSFTIQNNFHEKLKDVNNSAYVDSFFSYLTSTLLHTHGFLHGLDFYGSFLSIKENYPVNIYDDIEYINDYDFFHKNKDILFSVDESYGNMVGNDTRNYKQKINVLNEQVSIQLSDISEINNTLEQNISDLKINNLQQISPEIDVVDLTCDTKPDVIYENLISKKSVSTSKSKSSSSSCSSRSSNSSIEDKCDELSESGEEENDDSDNNNSDNESDNNSDNESDGYSSIDGEEVIVKIKQFPVQMIALECCEDTLNSLIEDDENPLTDEEWESIVLQILMSLITYQNVFSLTHNDLHANNIMYTNTDKQYIYYKVDDIYYKVPTFGKLFKIIDFGRAIYKFKGELLCSDSFHPKGDAATQYNFPPYFNNKKSLVEPNFSFDLCRLGCSIYDYIMEDDSRDISPIMQIIIEWCRDDKGRNILYKKNGDERYPDFKLYKMISRKVHSHVPILVLRNSYFDKFKVTKKKIPKEKNIINIDDIPSYF